MPTGQTDDLQEILLTPGTEISFFTTCKPFRGDDARMQRNAIASWRCFDVPVTIIGDEKGAAEIAGEYDCCHVSRVARSDTGMPLVNSLFDVAEQASPTPFLAYLNSDIIVDQNAVSAMRKFVSLTSRPTNFLYTSRRINLPLNSSFTIESNMWQQQFSILADKFGTWDHPTAIDLFMFNRGWLKNIPDLTIGRAGWDNWMLFNARANDIAIVDASASAAVYHPFHGYEGVSGGFHTVHLGDDASANRIQGKKMQNSIADSATHYFDGQGCHRLTQEDRNLNRERFSVNLHKRREADIRHLINTRQKSTAKELSDLVQTVLWRNDMYVPVWCLDREADGSGSRINVVMARRDSFETNNLFLEALQSAVCENLFVRLREIAGEKRPIFVWGAGTSGERFVECAVRHGIPVSGFVDNAVSAGATVQREAAGTHYDIVAPNEVMKHPDCPYIMVASIYLQEIADQLASMNLMKGDDFWA